MNKFTRIFLFSILLACGLHAQTWNISGTKQRFASGLGLPVKTVTAINGSDSAQLWINPSDSTLRFVYHNKIYIVGKSDSSAVLVVHSITAPGFTIDTGGNAIMGSVTIRTTGTSTAPLKTTSSGEIVSATAGTDYYSPADTASTLLTQNKAGQTYQPLENQRLSTSNSPSFTGLDLLPLTSLTVPSSGVMLEDSTGAGLTFLFPNGVRKNLTWKYVTGNATFSFQNKSYTLADSADVAALNSTVSGHTSQIASLIADTSTLAPRFLSVNNTLTAHSSAITALNADSLYQASQIAALNSTVSGHTSQIASLIADTSTLQTRLNNILTIIGSKGTATFSASGTTLTFSIAHGLGVTPSWINIQPGSSDAKLYDYITADSTYIYINFSLAPGSGTNNVKFYWAASK